VIFIVEGFNPTLDSVEITKHRNVEMTQSPKLVLFLLFVRTCVLSSCAWKQPHQTALVNKTTTVVVESKDDC
jgi:hypothetical protein